MGNQFQSAVRKLAYDQTEGAGPGVVFLGGFMSNKEGTKALWLENWAKAQGRAYLRFDYSGHGASSGAFEDGTFSDWLDDAALLYAAAHSIYDGVPYEVSRISIGALRSAGELGLCHPKTFP